MIIHCPAGVWNSRRMFYTREGAIGGGRVVRELSLGSKGLEFDPSMMPSVVKIANHC